MQQWGWCHVCVCVCMGHHIGAEGTHCGSASPQGLCSRMLHQGVYARVRARVLRVCARVYARVLDLD